MIPPTQPLKGTEQCKPRASGDDPPAQIIFDLLIS